MIAPLPPAIEFMLSEFEGAELTLTDVSKRLRDKAFVKDYFDQCFAGIESFQYADVLQPRFDKFDIYAGTGLDPLSGYGKCRELQCRIDYAHHFARTACLYADRVAITDPFSFTIEAPAEEIFLALVVLKILKPLLDAGIIIFRPAAFTACAQCAKVTEATEKGIIRRLWHEFTHADPNVFRYKDGRRWHISFGSPLFTSDGVEYRLPIPATREAIAATKPHELVSGKTAMNVVRHYREAIQEHFARCAHGVVFNTVMGSRCNTTLATNTKEEAVAFRSLDRRKLGVMQPDWSMLRRVPLPALEQL